MIPIVENRLHGVVYHCPGCFYTRLCSAISSPGRKRNIDAIPNVNKGIFAKCKVLLWLNLNLMMIIVWHVEKITFRLNVTQKSDNCQFIAARASRSACQKNINNRRSRRKLCGKYAIARELDGIRKIGVCEVRCAFSHSVFSVCVGRAGQWKNAPNAGNTCCVWRPRLVAIALTHSRASSPRVYRDRRLLKTACLLILRDPNRFHNKLSTDCTRFHSR